MRTLRYPLVVAASLAALVAVPAPNALATRTKPSRTPTDQVTDKDFSAKRFSARSIDVDNPFLPLTPGAQFTLTGTTTGGKHDVV